MRFWAFSHYIILYIVILRIYLLKPRMILCKLMYVNDSGIQDVCTGELMMYGRQACTPQLLKLF